jgi:undecaprenyl-diphosphatase
MISSKRKSSGWPLIGVALWLVLGTTTFAAVSASGEERAAFGMPLGQAVLLGLVEGLTEYLPVSSTGHLLLVERALALGRTGSSPSPSEEQRTKDATNAYTVCIQIGAIFAVVGLYAQRVKRMMLGIVGRDPEGLQMTINIMAAFFPAAVIGLMFNKLIKTYLFGPWPVVAAWFAGGLAILVVAWSRRVSPDAINPAKSLGELTWNMALLIGFAQCIAMWPGVSRSLVTIVGGVLVGLSLPAAVEFSFLLGVVTLSAATFFDSLKHGGDMLATFHLLPLIVGIVVAFVSAILSVKWMVSYLNRHGLELFGYYRLALAILVGALLVTKVI